jgi:hypothetical protein
MRKNFSAIALSRECVWIQFHREFSNPVEQVRKLLQGKLNRAELNFYYILPLNSFTASNAAIIFCAGTSGSIL